MDGTCSVALRVLSAQLRCDYHAHSLKYAEQRIFLNTRVQVPYTLTTKQKTQTKQKPDLSFLLVRIKGLSLCGDHTRQTVHRTVCPTGNC